MRYDNVWYAGESGDFLESQHFHLGGTRVFKSCRCLRGCEKSDIDFFDFASVSICPHLQAYDAMPLTFDVMKFGMAVAYFHQLASGGQPSSGQTVDGP